MKLRAPLMCVILIWSSAEFCAPSLDDLVAHKEAGARLTALIQTAQEKNQISQLKKPEVMSLVKSISDESRVLKPGSYTSDELETLLDICDVANRASVSLTLFDLKTHLNQTMTQPQLQAEAVALTSRNTAVFQDELKELQPFLIRCLAKEIQPMTQFMASLKPADLTDVRRQGLAQLRSGLLQIYSGALQAANETGYRDDYRIALLAALAETTVHFVSIIQLPERKQLHDLVTIASSKIGASYKVHLTRIANALSNDICEGLCAIR
jgi:hypothetical protein